MALARAETPISPASRKDGIQKAINTKDITSSMLPYSLELRAPQVSSENIPVITPYRIENISFGESTLAGRYGLVRLVSVRDENGNDIPLLAKTYPNDAQATLIEVQSAKFLSDDLGIGARFHGIFTDAQGRLNVVTDIVPGEMNYKNSTEQTYEDLEQIIARLKAQGINNYQELQIHKTPEGRLLVIDPGDIVTKKNTPATNNPINYDYVERERFVIQAPGDVSVKYLKRLKIEQPRIWDEIRNSLTNDEMSIEVRDYFAQQAGGPTVAQMLNPVDVTEQGEMFGSARNLGVGAVTPIENRNAARQEARSIEYGIKLAGPQPESRSSATTQELPEISSNGQEPRAQSQNEAYFKPDVKEFAEVSEQFNSDKTKAVKEVADQILKTYRSQPGFETYDFKDQQVEVSEGLLNEYGVKRAPGQGKSYSGNIALVADRYMGNNAGNYVVKNPAEIAKFTSSNPPSKEFPMSYQETARAFFRAKGWSDEDVQRVRFVNMDAIVEEFQKAQKAGKSTDAIEKEFINTLKDPNAFLFWSYRQAGFGPIVFRDRQAVKAAFDYRFKDTLWIFDEAQEVANDMTFVISLSGLVSESKELEEAAVKAQNYYSQLHISELNLKGTQSDKDITVVQTKAEYDQALKDKKLPVLFTRRIYDSPMTGRQSNLSVSQEVYDAYGVKSADVPLFEGVLRYLIQPEGTSIDFGVKEDGTKGFYPVDSEGRVQTEMTFNEFGQLVAAILKYNEENPKDQISISKQVVTRSTMVENWFANIYKASRKAFMTGTVEGVEALLALHVTGEKPVVN
ncbi:MAG: hypothetical protein JNN05_08920, partial [Candidatus Omnitrophica bacterium]|nr:hypothetical protein [Candidatus Omnitrophota bacterium]